MVMVPKINLFYLSPMTTGGWVTYTAHLTKAIEAVGVRWSLYRITTRTETKKRSYGYGIEYQNVSMVDAEKIVRAGKNPSLITGLYKPWIAEKGLPLLNHGAWLVVHDPAELGRLPRDLDHRYITVRQSTKDQIPDGHLLLHPYKRMRPHHGERQWACSIARIDHDKKTHILLDANRLLPNHRQIYVYGFENRNYSRFWLVPNYEEWTQSVHAYPREMDAAVNICKNYRFTCDMSVIKNDGGGTQYSFLEAMDASSVCVLNSKWIREGGEMIPYPNNGYNCFTIDAGTAKAETIMKNGKYLSRRMIDSGGEQLAKLFKTKGLLDLAKVANENAQLVFKAHSPKRIGRKLLRILGLPIPVETSKV